MRSLFVDNAEALSRRECFRIVLHGLRSWPSAAIGKQSFVHIFVDRSMTRSATPLQMFRCHPCRGTSFRVVLEAMAGTLPSDAGLLLHIRPHM